MRGGHWKQSVFQEKASHLEMIAWGTSYIWDKISYGDEE